MKSKRSSNIREEEEGINIMWNGKDIQSPKQPEKTNQPSPTMETWFNYTKTDINYRSRLDNKEQRTWKRRKMIKTQRNIEETPFH
jgi:hypothetical protein